MAPHGVEPTYLIAGPADSVDFAKMEYLGELIMRNTPNVYVEVHRLHPEDWPTYAREACARLGFVRHADGHSPFAWTAAGYLVGDATAFGTDVRAREPRPTLGVSPWA